MDRNTVHLYTILGVSKTASPAELKRSYRRLALRYHPDKSSDPQDAQRFRDIAHAYEILSDPKKRAVYDKYGEIGVSMLGSVSGSFLYDPAEESKIQVVFLSIGCSCLLLIVFFSFLSIRVDGLVSWSYLVVFVPLWIVDAVLLVLLILNVLSPVDDEILEDREDLDNEDEQEGDGRGGREARRERLKRSKRLFLRLVGLYFLLNVACFCLFHVLIALKSEGAAISGVLVFAPIFFYQGLSLLYQIVKVLLAKSGLMGIAYAAQVTQDGFFLTLFSSTFDSLLFIIQGVLIALKVDGVFGFSWAAVFAPLYCFGLFLFSLICKQFRRVASLTDDQRELKQQARAFVICEIIIFLVGAAFFYTPLGLLVAKLDGTLGIRLSIILIPVFIVTSFFACCCGCFIPCLMCIINMDDMDESRNHLVSSDRLIEAPLASPLASTSTDPTTSIDEPVLTSSTAAVL